MSPSRAKTVSMARLRSGYIAIRVSHAQTLANIKPRVSESWTVHSARIYPEAVGACKGANTQLLATAYLPATDSLPYLVMALDYNLITETGGIPITEEAASMVY